MPLDSKDILKHFSTRYVDFIMYNSNSLIDNCLPSFYNAMTQLNVVVEHSVLRLLDTFSPISLANIVLSSFSLNQSRVIIPMTISNGYIGIKDINGEIYFNQYKIDNNGEITEIVRLLSVDETNDLFKKELTF